MTLDPLDGESEWNELMGTSGPRSVIRIAAALIFNETGRILLVRKRGTQFFMQPGGKIEPNETPIAALLREVLEELSLEIDRDAPVYLGKFVAEAANEEDYLVDADVFEARIFDLVVPTAEIEEIAWVDPFSPPILPLAPLTRDHILPIARERYPL